ADEINRTPPKTQSALLEAMRACEVAGADSITVHLRADRRHIQERDIRDLREAVAGKLNLEMGNTREILEIALDAVPDFVCLVPENRQEITTEGGLDAVAHAGELEETVRRLQGAGIEVSLFIDPEQAQVKACADLGVEMVELHTGAFANAAGDSARRDGELGRLIEGAGLAHGAGLRVNAGHGINSGNIRGLYRVPHLVELNIGHHLVSRAITVGLAAAIAEMRALMDGYGS
ncbi:MAG: pyridoxine 5'-phosphate synthase, partial [Verrucomicrobiales bacterium]